MCAGFLRAAEANDYDKAAQYLDGKRSPKQSEELASELKYLLDQGMSTSIDDLSRSPNGNIEDQLRLSREYIGTVKTPNGDFKLMLDLVKRPEQPSVWLFSQETLNLVPHAYASMQHTDYEHFFSGVGLQYSHRVSAIVAVGSYFLVSPLRIWHCICSYQIRALVVTESLSQETVCRG
jgi:hypothetical protein